MRFESERVKVLESLQVEREALQKDAAARFQELTLKEQSIERELIERGHQLLQDHLERQRVLNEDFSKKEVSLKESWYAKESDFEKIKLEWEKRAAQKDAEREHEHNNRKAMLEKAVRRQRKQILSGAPAVGRGESARMGQGLENDRKAFETRVEIEKQRLAAIEKSMREKLDNEFKNRVMVLETEYQSKFQECKRMEATMQLAMREFETNVKQESPARAARLRKQTGRRLPETGPRPRGANGPADRTARTEFQKDRRTARARLQQRQEGARADLQRKRTLS